MANRSQFGEVFSKGGNARKKKKDIMEECQEKYCLYVEVKQLLPCTMC